MDKKRNLVTKVHLCGISKANRVLLSGLFDIVTYCDHKDVADKAIRQIQETKTEKLKKYLKGHVLPALKSFARSYAWEHFACGVTTTSAAGGMNRMPKKGFGNCYRSLAQASQRFTGPLENHAIEVTSQ
jgi:hypothetical protein